MKTFRIRFTKTIESVVEIESSSITDAWKRIKGEKLVAHGPDKNIVWMQEGELTYKAESTEEITRQMTSIPK